MPFGRASSYGALRLRPRAREPVEDVAARLARGGDRLARRRRGPRRRARGHHARDARPPRRRGRSRRRHAPATAHRSRRDATPSRSARRSPWVPLPDPGAPSRTSRTGHDRTRPPDIAHADRPELHIRGADAGGRRGYGSSMVGGVPPSWDAGWYGVTDASAMRSSATTAAMSPGTTKPGRPVDSATNTTAASGTR